MTDGTIRGHTDQMSADRVLAATGRTPEDWYAVLDEQGAVSWGHTAVAAWVLEQGVDGWWAQGVTIGYEQARGLRIPGQRLVTTEPGAAGKVRVSAERGRLTGPERMPDAKAELQELIARL